MKLTSGCLTRVRRTDFHEWYSTSESEGYAGATHIAHYNEQRHPTKSAVIMAIENGVKRFLQHVDP